MNINVHIADGEEGYVGLQVFDNLYAYAQSKNHNDDYKTDLTVEFTKHKNIKPNSINILFTHMPRIPITDINDYDLVLLDNGDEPLEVSTQVIHDTLMQYDHSYLIANAFLHDSHELKSKIIVAMCDVGKFNDYQTRSFYPQYYEFSGRKNTRTHNISFINGANKAHRWHVMSLIKQNIPEIKIKSTLAINGGIHETNDCFFESDEDSTFREWLNGHYPITRNVEYMTHWDNFFNISIGVDNKFGTIPGGYFFMEEYFNYNCIIVPETSWINGQLSLTEKSIKCFYSGAFSLPVSGSRVNQLYNEIGFRTAWNLLPSKLQEYDYIDNHQERYQKLILAIQWLEKNPQVFNSAQANAWRTENQLHILRGKFSLYGVKKLEEILNSI